MSRKQKIRITDRVTSCCGIISCDLDDVNDIKIRFWDVLDTYSRCQQFYYIVHDSDEDTPFKHIHFILCFKGQQSLQRVLNVISEGLNINVDAIQLDKLNSLGGYLRYILHVDKESVKLNKHQYSITDIVSNQVQEIIQSYIDSKDEDISTDVLINLVIDTNYDYEIMDIIGIKLYHKYRYEIKVLRDEQGILRENRRIEHEKDLPF